MKEIEVFVQGEGLSKVVVIKLPKHGTIKDLLAAAAAHLPRGQDADWFVFLEDTEELLEADAGLEACGLHHHGHVHIHRCRRVEVTVNFNGESKSRKCPPSATIQRVKHWAAREFKLSEPDALEHTLQVCGTQDRPADTVHIGTLVTQGHCTVCFDLVPKHRVEG